MTRTRSFFTRVRIGSAVVLIAALAFLPVSADAATELLMFEQKGCTWCALWHEEIGPIYPKSAEGKLAPLRELDVRHPPSSLALASPIVFAPTFVIVKDRKEVGRITGYPGADFFWGLLSRILLDSATK
ncbi:MAG: thioredoxin family protein [Proteobacteria bacterium]|nr:thioredoxin family protein [Pseudomonadota bacterium]